MPYMKRLVRNVLQSSPYPKRQHPANPSAPRQHCPAEAECKPQRQAMGVTFFKQYKETRAINFNNIFFRLPWVVLWLRICQSMRGTQVRSLVQEDPTCLRAPCPWGTNTKACVHWSLCSTERKATTVRSPCTTTKK